MGILYGEGGNAFDDIRVARATYDFATHGGAVSTDIGLGVYIPHGAVVTDFVTVPNVAFTSDGAATVAMSIGAVEFNALTAFANVDYTALTAHAAITPVKINPATATGNANAEVTIDIAVADLTAGNYDVFVLYYMGTDINYT